MEERHHQLADIAVHGLAVAQHRMVGLGDGSPVAALFEHGQHVGIVVFRCDHLHRQGLAAVQAQGDRRQQRTLDAMRVPRTQDGARRQAGLTLELEVALQAVDEVLDLARRVEPLEDPQLGLREPRSVSEAASHQALRGFRVWRALRGLELAGAFRAVQK